MDSEVCCSGMKVSDEYFKPYDLPFFKEVSMNTHFSVKRDIYHLPSQGQRTTLSVPVK